MVYFYMEDNMYRLVLDINTMRVIYFTSDLNEKLTPTREILFFDYLSELPPQMKLSNCWNWRLEGVTLVESLAEIKVNPNKETIFEFNKQECLNYLVRKINEARFHLSPDCDLGLLIRVYKYQQTYEQHSDYLDALALMNNMHTHQYVEKITKKESEVMAGLRISEINREYFKTKILNCIDSTSLYEIRDMISKHNMLELLDEYETSIN